MQGVNGARVRTDANSVALANILDQGSVPGKWNEGEEGYCFDAGFAYRPLARLLSVSSTCRPPLTTRKASFWNA